MPLTPNLSTVTVSGTYVDISGTAIAGQVGFTPRTVLTDTVANQIVIPKKITVTLDANGSFSTVLPATDDTDLVPYNFTYYVEELFTGGRNYDINVPAGSALNLADVAPSTISTGAGTIYVTLSQYNTLNSQLQTIVTTITTSSSLVASLNNSIAAANSAAASSASAANSALDYVNAVHPFVLMGV